MHIPPLLLAIGVALFLFPGKPSIAGIFMLAARLGLVTAINVGLGGRFGGGGAGHGG